MPQADLTEARVAQYELQIQIEAAPSRVWRGLTDQLAQWWLPDFHALGPESIVTLEPHAGGRFVEQLGERELLWFTVAEISPGESLTLVGALTADWGGPATTQLTLKLEAKGDATVLHVRDALYGRVTDKLISSLESGWKQLFGDGLKAFVESN